MLNNDFKINAILANSFDHIYRPSNTFLFLNGDEKAIKAHCKSIFRGRMVRMEIIHVIEKINQESVIPYYSEIQIQCGQDIFLKDFSTPVFQLDTSIADKGEISIISDDVKKVQFLSDSIYKKGNVNSSIHPVEDLRNLKSFFINSNYNGWIIYV